jgi:threonine/homoserine/homoserine lactone efflux protein
MNQELWVGAALFVVASSITPGPNNTMLMASGVRFGFRRTFAHLMGVQLGFGFMLLSVGMGLHTVLAQFEGFYDVVRVAGAAYMVWIAWKLASAKAHQDDLQHAEQPMGFWAAVAFQWVNPKAWVMAVGAITTYTPAQGYVTNVVVLAAVFALVNLPSVGEWDMFGSALRNFSSFLE